MHYKQRQKSAIIAKCKPCGGRYEVKKFQSEFICEYCRATRKCVHAIELFVPCEVCIRIHGNALYRVM